MFRRYLGWIILTRVEDGVRYIRMDGMLDGQTATILRVAPSIGIHYTVAIIDDCAYPVDGDGAMSDTMLLQACMALSVGPPHRYVASVHGRR